MTQENDSQAKDPRPSDSAGKRDFDTRAADWEKADARTMLAGAIAQAILDDVPLDSSMHLLDFGAGTGLLNRPLLPKIGKLTALDSSEKMLEMLVASAPQAYVDRITTVFADVMTAPANFEGAFDGIISSMTMHHVADIPALMAQLRSYCKPGAFLALADLRSEDGSFHGGDNTGVEHFGFDEPTLLAQTAAAGFGDVAMRTVHVVEKPEQRYPIFLLTARRPA